MSKNSSIATDKPRMGVLRMARVNCIYYPHSIIGCGEFF